MRPLDAMEQYAETAGSLGVDAFDEGNAPGEVRAKVGVAGAVLDVRSSADAVGEDGLQLVEILAREVAVLIDDKPGEMLAYARTHETGLAVMDKEALFDGDGSDPDGEACGVLYECLIAGEGEVVGIAGVDRAGGSSKSGEAAVQPPAADVCDGRRGGRALGEMGAVIKVSNTS